MDYLTKAKLMSSLKQEYEFCMKAAWPGMGRKNEHFVKQAERVKAKMESLERGEQILPDVQKEEPMEGFFPNTSYVLDRAIAREEKSRKEETSGLIPTIVIVLIACVFILWISFSSRPILPDPKLLYLTENNCSISEITPTLDIETKLVGRVHVHYYRWNETYMCDNGKISYSIWNKNKPFGTK